MPSVEREVALGREVDLQLRESLSVYDERPELTRLVNEVGAKVAEIGLPICTAADDSVRRTSDPLSS